MFACLYIRIYELWRVCVCSVCALTKMRTYWIYILSWFTLRSRLYLTLHSALQKFQQIGINCNMEHDIVWHVLIFVLECNSGERARALRSLWTRHKMQNTDANRGKDAYRLIYLSFLRFTFHSFSFSECLQRLFHSLNFPYFCLMIVKHLQIGNGKSPNAMVFY